MQSVIYVCIINLRFLDDNQQMQYINALLKLLVVSVFHVESSSIDSLDFT